MSMERGENFTPARRRSLPRSPQLAQSCKNIEMEELKPVPVCQKLKFIDQIIEVQRY